MERERAFVVKIGGKVINDPVALESFLGDFARIEGKKILVHGGGNLLETFSEKLGIRQTMIDGRRVTDAETLELALMVYAGAISKRIVAGLQKYGCNAAGFSGADMNLVRASKRKPGAHDFGFVGDVEPSSVNAEALGGLLNENITPVFCAVTHDGEGQLLNTNADSLAYVLACALAPAYDVQLHYCFERRGVMRDVNDPDSILPTITGEAYRRMLEENSISGGMLPKLDTAFSAIRNGVGAVVIGHAGELVNAINKKENAGTYLVA
jgi:acetylglutamate kinase